MLSDILGQLLNIIQCHKLKRSGPTYRGKQCNLDMTHSCESLTDFVVSVYSNDLTKHLMLLLQLQSMTKAACQEAGRLTFVEFRGNYWCLFIDHFRAFNMVDHNILWQRLLGTQSTPRAVVCKWWQTQFDVFCFTDFYLSSNELSGSVLGSLLLAIYIVDLCQKVSDCLSLK